MTEEEARTLKNTLSTYNVVIAFNGSNCLNEDNQRGASGSGGTLGLVLVETLSLVLVESLSLVLVETLRLVLVETLRLVLVETLCSYVRNTKLKRFTF